MMITIIAGLAVVILCLSGVRSLLRRAAGIGCCGGGRGDDVRQTGPNDKHKSHYPIYATMEINGMKCRNCAVRTENALNTVDGIYARVCLREKKAVMFLKKDITDEKLEETVRSAGYAAGGISRKIRRTDV